jgi:hypothetical protein
MDENGFAARRDDFIGDRAMPELAPVTSAILPAARPIRLS